MKHCIILFTVFFCALGAIAQNDVHVASNADIGVGTDSPADKIHVYESTLPYIRVSNATTGLGSGLRLGINGPGHAWLYTLGAYDMNLGTNGAARIHLDAAGFVGIGDSDPYTTLTMGGPIGFRNNGSHMMYMYQSGFQNPDKPVIIHSPTSPTYGLFYKDSIDNFYLRGGDFGSQVWFDLFEGNIGIEYENPYNDLILAGTTAGTMPIIRIGHTGGFNEESSGAIIFEENIGGVFGSNFCGVAMRMNGVSNDLEFHGGCTVNFATSELIMTMDRGGFVGIGTTPNSTYRLQVAGRIRAEEVVVETGWADYVFEPGYNLLSLDEVESHIRTFKHLPGVPAGHTIESEGLAVGQMSEIFIRKIEELTLYTIEQEKSLAEHRSALYSLQQQNTDLEKQLAIQSEQIEELIALTRQLASQVETADQASNKR